MGFESMVRSMLYAWNFEVYYGKENASPNPENVEEVSNPIIVPVHRGEPKLAHNVVLKMVEGLGNVGHLMVMDNFFSSIGLFMDLLSIGIYASGTVRPNWVGLPLDLNDMKSFKNVPQGHILWRMHDSRNVACVMWKDKNHVLLISTHALAIQPPCEFPVIMVPRRQGAVQESIPTSAVLLEYTTYMWGVDVADELRALYSCQIQSHRWWHWTLFFPS